MWVRMVSGTVVSVLVVVAGIFALRADGEPVHDVVLTDGGVWVSGGRTGNWGRVNTGSHALDVIIGGAGETAETPGPRVERPDILQDGRNVIGVTGVDDGTTQDRELVAIDPSTGSALDGSARVPATQITSGATVFVPDVVALNGNTLAVVDHATGNLWAQRLDPEGGSSVDGLTDGAPLREVGPNAAVAVSEEGDVMVVSAENGTVVDVPAEGEGFGSPQRTDLPFEGSGIADITTVGADWVVLDTAAGMIHAPDLDRPRPLTGSGDEPGRGPSLAALQQSGPGSATVAVQTTERAEYVPIHEGETTSEVDAGISSGLQEDAPRPEFRQLSRPVRSGDCLYAAWGRGNGVLWGSSCGDESTSTAEISIVSDIIRYSGVVVRYNRGQVLLNDLDTGRVFDLSVSVDPRIDTWPGGAPRAEPTPYTPDHEKTPGPAPAQPSTTSG